MLRGFVGLVESFVFGTPHNERTSGDGYHPDGGGCSGDRFRIVREGADVRRFRIYLGVLYLRRRYSGHLPVLVVGVVMPGIQVTTYALETVFLLVVVVIQVGYHSIIRDALRVQVYVTLLAGFIIHYFLCILEFLLYLPVDVFGILGDIGPYVLHSCLRLGHEMVDGTFRRKMACGAVRFHARLSVIVYRHLPGSVSISMIVARHAGTVL